MTIPVSQAMKISKPLSIGRRAVHNGNTPEEAVVGHSQGGQPGFQSETLHQKISNYCAI